MKLMAPVFFAFDRQHYRRLIPAHLADCLHLPEHIQENFEAGGFVVSITGMLANTTLAGMELASPPPIILAPL